MVSCHHYCFVDPQYEPSGQNVPRGNVTTRETMGASCSTPAYSLPWPKVMDEGWLGVRRASNSFHLKYQVTQKRTSRVLWVERAMVSSRLEITSSWSAWALGRCGRLYPPRPHLAGREKWYRRLSLPHTINWSIRNWGRCLLHALQLAYHWEMWNTFQFLFGKVRAR